MKSSSWKTVPRTNEEANDLWELYHENSKLGRYSQSPPDQAVREWIKQVQESLPYEGYPKTELPPILPRLKASLTESISQRASVRELAPGSLTLGQVARLLHSAYGITRDNSGTAHLRSFRTVPSGGALYPLELYFHSAHIRGLEAGLYHYNPAEHAIRRLRGGDATQTIATCLVQPEVGRGATVILFITAVFERSAFKYGERAYRFILLEAGHVAQNVNLVATAIGLGCVNIGGFFDREIDRFLGLDGITQSVLYVAAIGRSAKGSVRRTSR